MSNDWTRSSEALMIGQGQVKLGEHKACYLVQAGGNSESYSSGWGLGGETGCG